MKKLRYILLLAMFAANVAAQAQVNYSAMEKAFAIILHKYPFQADSVAYRMIKKYKKQPTVYVCIARAYFRNQNNGKAEKYIAEALHQDTLFAPAYVLKGDMALFARDTTQAAQWYQTAIKANPHEASSYLKYVEVVAPRNAAAAIAMLDSMKIGCPYYPVNLAQAAVLYSSGDFAKASVVYSGVEKDLMTDEDRTKYAASLYFLQDFQNSLDVTREAMERYPRYLPLDRMAFYDLAELKKYDEALSYGEKLMEGLHGTGKASYRDVMYYGVVNDMCGNHVKAIDVFTCILNEDTTYCASFTSDDLKDAQSHINSIISKVKADSGFNEAKNLYQHFMANKKRTTAYDEYMYTDIYKDLLDKAIDSGQGQQEAYNRLDSVYTDFEKKYPTWNQIDLVYYYHASYCAEINDPQVNNGSALLLYQQLIKTDEPQQLTSREKRMLKNAYLYIGYYYVSQNQMTRAKDYFRKLLIVDPDNSDAKRILEQ
jgi:tetratricopeptide (TPR) repeat protein